MDTIVSKIWVICHFIYYYQNLFLTAFIVMIPAVRRWSQQELQVTLKVIQMLKEQVGGESLVQRNYV